MTMELITNRTQHNVDTLTRLRRKGWQNLSATERAEYLGNAALGAYNYTDLNRVESAVASISSTKNLGLVTKTNWSAWDTPTQSDMERYLGNINAVKQMEMPLIPETLLPVGDTYIPVDLMNSVYGGQKVALYFDGVRYEKNLIKDGDIFRAGFKVGDTSSGDSVNVQMLGSRTRISVSSASGEHTISLFGCGTPELAGIPLPASMGGLTYESANNIEKVLEIAYALVGPINNALGVARLGEIILS